MKKLSGNPNSTVRSLRSCRIGAAVVCLFSLGFLQSHAAETNTLVLPPEAADMEGGASGGPFRDPVDYQLAYHGSLFAETGGPTLITGIAWRVDADRGGSFEVTIPDFQIWASTFPGQMSELSTDRENNWGADRILVLDAENVRLVGAGGATPNILAFG